MSITAIYARVSGSEIEQIKSDPEKLWLLPNLDLSSKDTSVLRRSEIYDSDKEWEVLAWLCSDAGRAQARYQCALINISSKAEDEKGFDTALRESFEQLGLEYVDPRTQAQDLVFKAICGSPEGEGEKIDGLGLGACIFSAGEVSALGKALNDLDEDWLRERFNVDEFVLLGLPGDGDESEFDEFYLPALKRLRAMYDRASKQRQHILIVMG